MRPLLRYLALAALLFWLGGFTFYVSVVVPMGTKVLKSGRRQGFITREVTGWLNVAAAGGLAVLAAELAAGGDPSRWRFRARAAQWAFMAGCQAGLFYLHGQLDGLLQVQGGIVLDPEEFYWRHRVYLWLHTVQWMVGLVYIALMLGAWRAEDRADLLREMAAQKSPAADRFGVAQSPNQPHGGTLSS